MNITERAIASNRITAVAAAMIMLAGLSAFKTLPRNEDPGFIIRTATVVTYYPGASPQRVEQLVTEKIEKVIQEMPELDSVTSESKNGVSIIFVNILERYSDMQPLWDKLRRKVEKAEPELPEGAFRPVVDDEFGDVFGIIITVTGDGFSYSELEDVADEVRDELLLIGDVAKVEIYGAQEERIFVEYSNSRLSEFGISPLQLQGILEAQNIVISGGDINTGFERIALEPSGNFESVEDLRRAVIQVPGRSELVYLEDVATVSRGYIDPPSTKMHANGEESLGLAVSMRAGGDIIALGENVSALIDRVLAYYPIGIDFDYIQFQPESVRAKIDDFVDNLLQAVVLVTAVMLATLGIRTGLVVASLIPMAMLMSLMIMQWMGIGLDQVSLASLIIALGMLVDNAIVMSESIMVQMGEGKPPVRAAVDSAKELQVSLLTSSLTTAAAFLPIYLAESSSGEYTAPLFKVVTITLLSSWLLSITLIPLLCARFLRVKPGEGVLDLDSRLYAGYRRMLVGLLRHRSATLVAVVMVFALAMKGFAYIPAIFFPPNDRPTFTVDLKLPMGTPIERTEEVVDHVEGFMSSDLKVGKSRRQGIVNWGTFIGQGAPRFILTYSPEKSAAEYAMMVVNASSRAVMDGVMARLERFCNENFPDLKATVRPLEMGPPTWPPIAVRVSGRDEGRLFELVDSIKAELESIPGTKLIDDDWGARSKKILVQVDQERARRAGVTSQDVAISLQTFLSGFETTEYREGDKLIPVTMRSLASERQDIGKLETLNIYAQASGQSVPLRQVADIEVRWQASRIARYDRLKTVTVEAGLDAGVTASRVNSVLVPWLDEHSSSWPLGYSWALGGEAESSGESNAAIGAKLPIAGLIIVLLLVGQFNSIRRPLIIMLTVPLGLIGVVVGLLAAQSYFGFMTLLGVISLAGIVINNAIVLIDRIGLEIDENGLSADRAIIEAAQRRLRPIILTTGTTAGGLVPLWLGGGPMWEPMAISIIFGLVFATVLTLGVVPVLYSVLFRVNFKDFA